MSFFQYLPKPASAGTPTKHPHSRPKSTSKKSTNECTNESFIRAPAPKKTAPAKPRAKKGSRSAPTNTVPPAPSAQPSEGPKFSDKIDVDTCDILYIDEQIKKKLRSKIRILPDLQKDLARLLWISTFSSDNIDKIQARSETALLRRTIQDIEGGFELALYLLKTADILEEYKLIQTQTSTSSFVRTKASTDSANSDTNKFYRKNQIVQEFLRIAKAYVVLENFRQRTPQRMVCEACHSSAGLQPTADESILICKCGATVEILDDAPSFKDAERVNMASRYTYTCRGHFNEAMNRFEGKQNTEISSLVIDTLNRELALHGLTAKTVTKDHIYMFLSEKRLSDYYADINLIYFLIAGVNPPDITGYRNELLEMFDQLEEAYQEVKDDDRLNSLNVNWKLYKLLQLLDFACKKDDFFCLKTPTKQGEHEEKWHDMIEYLQTRYPRATTSSGKKRWRHIRTL